MSTIPAISQSRLQLSLSQPSVSNRIRRLEEKLSCQLLKRTTRRIDLTAGGARLHAAAVPMLTALKRLLQDFDAEAIARRTEVTVVATAMVATVALPPLVKIFSDLHPGISVRFQDRLPGSALRAVIDGTCDMAIMAADALPPEGRSEVLTTDTCVVVTPLTHPLCTTNQATLAEVLKYELLVPRGYVAMRKAIEVQGCPAQLRRSLCPAGQRGDHQDDPVGDDRRGFRHRHPSSLAHSCRTARDG